MKYRVAVLLDVEAASAQKARDRVSVTLPFFEANPWATVTALESALPNVPTVTTRQLVQYLAARYANCRRLGNLFRTGEPGELGEHYRRVAGSYDSEAAVYREIIAHVADGTAAGWVAGKAKPEDGRWADYAGIIARRFGFRAGAVERFLRSLSSDPFDAYARVVGLDDGEPTGAAWRFVWDGMDREGA